MMERDSNHEQKRGAVDARLDPARPRTDAEIAREAMDGVTYFGGFHESPYESIKAAVLRGVAAGRAEGESSILRKADGSIDYHGMVSSLQAKIAAFRDECAEKERLMLKAQHDLTTAEQRGEASRVAVLTAHRACCGVEHDPANGKLHGCCVVCGVPWPCDYAGQPPARGGR